MQQPVHTTSPNKPDPDVLLLDVATQEDLNLFAGEHSETNEDATAHTNSLFSFCNKTRSEGGERVLRRRMLAPWSSASRILGTQESLQFILAHRDAFTELPSAYIAPHAERYTRDSLPIIKDKSTFDFAVSAFSLWADEDRFYIRITRGVELSCRLIRALRELLFRLGTATPTGELAPLISEMRTLLEKPAIVDVPDHSPDRKFWRTLRLDQTFRWHEKSAIDRLIHLIYEIDALIALADVTKEHDLAFPELKAGPVSIKAEGLVHPSVPEAVGNPVMLDQSQRALFLTGPNMAGKTTYLRAVATALYFAHLGMGVPAKRFEFVPVERMLTAISLSDDINEGVSYFRAEALRVKAVAQAIADGYRVVAIMDEPFKGTNVKDAFDASVEILRRFASKNDCLFMITSHLIEVSERLDPALPIDYQYFEAQETENRLRFDYVLHPGVSSQRLGMRVLREEGIFDLLDGV